MVFSKTISVVSEVSNAVPVLQTCSSYKRNQLIVQDKSYAAKPLGVLHLRIFMSGSI